MKLHIVDKFSGPIETHETTRAEADALVRKVLDAWCEPGDRIVRSTSQGTGAQTTSWCIVTEFGEPVDIYAYAFEEV